MNLGDTIAKCCYDHYGNLSKKGKPQEGKEWTLLAAVVQETKNGDTGELGDFHVVAMGTGTKCLGKSKMSKTGDIVNDSHAEIIARRAFLKYLLYHVGEFYKTGSSEIFEKNDKTLQFSLKDGIDFHFFTSHTPCGDASIFPKEVTHNASCNSLGKRVHETESPVVAKKQKIEHLDCDSEIPDSTECNKNMDSHCLDDTKTDLDRETTASDIYRTGAKCVSSAEQDPLLEGAEYHCTGLLRTKPGRGERTLSMCCSDKLAKWNVVGCQGALLSHLIAPIYFKSFIVGSCPFNEGAMKRALISRFSEVHDLQAPYRLHQPLILQSTLEFEYSKHKVEAAVEKAVPSNTSIIWCNIPCLPVEVAVNGKKQGFTAKNINKPEARCSICKAELFSKFRKVVGTVETVQLPKTLRNPSLKTYRDFKEAADGYQSSWQLLLNVFKDWVQAPAELERFTLNDVT